MVYIFVLRVFHNVVLYDDGITALKSPQGTWDKGIHVLSRVFRWSVLTVPCCKCQQCY